MYCFNKTKRLLKKSDYDAVFNQSKKITTNEFIFLFCKNTVGHARLGLAISKKNIAKAHDRNRLKRLLRETFRLSELPDVDVVVLAKRGAAEIDNSQLISKLDKAWQILSAICKK